MKKSIWVPILLTLISLTIVAAQEQSRSKTKRIAFAKDVVERLGEKVSGEQRKLIETKATRWEQTMRESDWIELTDVVHTVAKSTKSQCEVEISTSKGTEATVKYQALGSRERGERPTTAKDLTKLSEEMFIGVYHIWSERGGKPTSDQDAQFVIVKEKEKVKLEEIK